MAKAYCGKINKLDKINKMKQPSVSNNATFKSAVEF